LVLFVLCEVAIWTSTEIDSRLTWWRVLGGVGKCIEKGGKVQKRKKGGEKLVDCPHAFSASNFN
jgi:hypothetical protein